MTWTYSGNPSASNRDAVRFLIGDTDSTNELLQDGEIAFLLSQANDDIYSAAASGCDVLASKFSSKSDTSKSVGDLSLSTQYGSQAGQWREQAKMLRARAAISSPPTPTFYTTDAGEVFGERHFSLDWDRNREP